MPKVKINSGEEIALTKATIRAADRLDISRKLLAEIIGLSEATLSRMRTGAFVLDRVNGKPFELAVLFVEMFELLEQLVLGDETTARAWLVGENKLLGGRPMDLIRSVRGLDHPDVQRALDNAGAHKLLHRDLLPWPKRPLRSARPLDP